MASKKEINKFLKENNLTVKEVNVLWEKASHYNNLIANLIKQGIPWKSMNIGVINQIPTAKETAIAMIKKENDDEKIRREKRELKLAEQKRLTNTLEEDDLLLERISLQNLSESEIRSIVFEDSCAKVIETKGLDNRRWVQGMSTIIQIEDQYFHIGWDRGLTENQEHTFNCQPYEVLRHEKKVTKTIVTWSSKQ